MALGFTGTVEGYLTSEPIQIGFGLGVVLVRES